MEETFDISNLSFMVVDDNKHICGLVRDLLYAFKSRNVHEATDAAAAFSKLSSFHTDIVVCDYNMAPVDGIDFIKSVRNSSNSPNPYVPIIMLSAHTEMNKIIKARDAGANEYLAKPVSAKSLYSRIHKIIAEPREFVQSKNYFGPDRRRSKNMDFSGTEQRQNQDAETLSQNELDEMFA